MVSVQSFYCRKFYCIFVHQATPDVSGWGSSNSSLPEEDQGSLLSPSDDRPEGVASDSEWPRENIEEFVLLPDDTLQSVLGRLNLSRHIPLFQVCIVVYKYGYNV